MKVEVDEDECEFGFIWGENDQFTYIWNTDGSIRRVPEEMIRGLKELSTGELDASDAPQSFLDSVQEYREEGYIVDNVEITKIEQGTSNYIPAKIAVAIGFMLAILYLVVSTVRVPSPSEVNLTTYAVIIAFNFIVIPIHEYAHYFTAKRYVPARVGLGTVNGAIPVAKTDTTQTWLLDRRHRIWVNLAGPGVHSVIVLVIIGVKVWYPETPFIDELMLVGIGGIVFSLNPMYHGDGYQIVCDLFDIKNLRKRGAEELKNLELSPYSIYAAISYIGVPALMISGLYITYITLGIWVLVFYVSYIILMMVIDFGETTNYLFTHKPDWVSELAEKYGNDEELF